MKNLIFLTIILAISTLGVSAQDATPTPIATPTPVPKTVSGGVVNSKAINLVRPTYPSAALAVGASGAVNVQVTIDEEGNVISATAVSGHPLLKNAAVQAARGSKFAITTLSGMPVKVAGIIVYNFVLDGNSKRDLSAEDLSLKLKTFALGVLFGVLKKADEPELEIELNKRLNDLPNAAIKPLDLPSLKKLSAVLRQNALNSKASEIKLKLTASELWQFNLGENFGELFVEFRNYAQNKTYALKQPTFQAILTKIELLTAKPPVEFSTYFLEDIKYYASQIEKTKLTVPENTRILLEMLDAVLRYCGLLEDIE